ncbi:MAG: hypothetical protein AAGG79_04745, partial [Pseudomonadota bacterium]
MDQPLIGSSHSVEPGPYPWIVYVLTDEHRTQFSISMAKDAGARALRHRICTRLKKQTPLLVLTE